MNKSFPGYDYVKRCEHGSNEISLDPSSNEFHPTQIMTAATLYSFPPYNVAGLADLASYLTSGFRSTHLNDDGTILGFTFNVAIPMSEKQEAFQKAWPEIYEYAKQVKEDEDEDEEEEENKFGDEKFCIDFVKRVEEKFGTSVIVNLKGSLNPLQALINKVSPEKVICVDLTI